MPRRNWNEVVEILSQLIKPTVSNPGNETTLWVNSADGELYFGATAITGPTAGMVDSVFGRVGDVVAEAGDYDGLYDPDGTAASLSGAVQINLDTHESDTSNPHSVTAAQVGAAVLDLVQTFTAGQAGEITALVDAANISINLQDSNNFSLTIGGNRQLDFPSPAPTPGQSGFITVTQGGAGSNVLIYGSGYVFAGGPTEAPVLSTTAGAVDQLVYYVIDASTVLISLSQADIS